MLKRLIITAFLFFLLSTQIKEAKAIYDPLSVPNNKFGIHIQSENDLEDAARLVNSSGGDWGYVTLVITEAERDYNRWQKVFDKMRRLHLIPIVRLATKFEDGVWTIPQKEEINNWIAFLNSLNWVVKNRYIVIGNEPNHAKEWGGKIDPEGYGNYLKEFSQKLKLASPDFFILPAGLDASAPNSPETMDEGKFISQMHKAIPDIFEFIDGWTSHSYPNPAFSGKAEDDGKGTVRTFDWELSYLKRIGIDKNLPVFITETGWSNQNLTEDEIGDRLKHAFEKAWTDKRVVAVTPFILNYTDSPFAEFSWKNKEGSFYSFFGVVEAITKTKGEPIQEVKGKIVGAFINPFLLANSSFKGVILAQNLGQSIWVSPEIEIKDESLMVEFATAHFGEIKPMELKLVYFSGTAPGEAGKYEISLVLKSKGKPISEKYATHLIVIKPAEVKNLSLFAKIQVWVRNFLGL